LHETKNEISKKDSAIIVEGYIDFLQLYQNQIKNVVAVSGTSLTDGHAHILKRLTDNIYIAYDGDAAGQTAAMRAGFVLLKNGLNPKVIQIPNNMDPDEWVLKSGSEPFLDSMNSSLNLIDFCFLRYKQNSQGDNVGAFISEMLNEFILIKDSVTIEINLKRLSKITDISFDSIKRKYNEVQEKKDERAFYRDRQKIKMQPENTSIEDDVIKLCFSKDNEIRHEIYSTLDDSWLISSSIKDIYNQVNIHLNSDYEPDVKVILDQLKQLGQDEAHRKLVELVFEIDKIEPTLGMARDSMSRLQYTYLKNNLESLRIRLKESENNFQDPTELINQITKIQNQINSIKGIN